MSELVRKSHNVTVLIYHYVCSAKYRKTVFDPKVDEILKGICLEIEKRYEIKFLEIGTDKNHVHFLIQSVPMYSPTKIIQMVKSLTAREIFKNYRVPIARYYSSEEILKNKNLYYDKLINDYYWTTKYLSEILKEAVGLGLVHTIDPKGKILREITVMTRGN